MNLGDARIGIVALQAENVFLNDPSRPMGGSEVQAVQIADMLAREFGCRVRFVCLCNREGVEQHGASEVAWVSRARGALDKIRAVHNALASFDADCVVQMGWGLETWLAARYARLCGKRFVYMIASYKDIVPFGWRDYLYWRRFLYRRGLLAADRIVAQSNDQIADLRRNFRREAVLIPSLQPPPEPPRDNKEGILWVGRAMPVKQPERLFDLAERLPDLPFVLIMNATHLREYSRRLAERAKNLPNVTYVPYVPYEKIMEHFHAARLCVGTSWAEGFPNAYLQAFRAATPVMSLQVDPDQIIRSNELGFVAGGDLAALAREIQRRYSDAEWLRETGRRCAEYLRANHSRGAIAQQWKELLLDLVG